MFCSITHTDKVLKLVKDLFLHPKGVPWLFLVSVKLFSPVTFFLITATLLLLIGIKYTIMRCSSLITIRLVIMNLVELYLKRLN
jgi:hypothetical protein